MDEINSHAEAASPPILFDSVEPEAEIATTAELSSDVDADNEDNNTHNSL